MSSEVIATDLEAFFDFSIITPVYNDERFIEQTLNSVISVCRNFSYEHIVINDGSTDGTSSILTKYKKSINLIDIENGGQANAINKGLAIARGKYSLIVNSDDPLLDSKLFTQAKQVLDNEKSIVCVYPDWQIIDECNRLVQEIKVKDYSFEELYCHFNCLVGPGGIFRTEVARKLEGWNSKYKYVPDYDFWLRMTNYGNFKHVDGNLASWRKHPNSISVKSKTYSMALERIEVINSKVAKLTNSNHSLDKVALANAYLNAAILGYFDPEIPAKKWLIKSISHSHRVLNRKNLAKIFFILGLPLSRKILNFLELKGLRRKLD